MNSLLIWLLYGLAVWRISHILVHEAGPFRIFDTVRWASNQIGWGEGEERRSLGELFGCIWCMSVWVAAGLVLVHPDRPDDVATVLMQVFSLSALAIIYASAGKLFGVVSRYVQYKL